MQGHPVRILQICLSRSWGGLEMAAFELARDMRARGFEITTACPKNSRLGEQILASNLPHVDIDARKYLDLRAVFRIRRAFREKAISNVVLHQLRDIWHVTPALLGFPRIRLSGFAHIFLSVSKNTHGHRWLYSRLDDLICLTDSQRQNFATHLPIRAEKIHVVPNPIDMTIYTPQRRNDALRSTLGADPSDILIGVIGRLDPAKGQMETVEATKQLIDSGIAVKVVLVGEETLNLKGAKAQLTQRIQELNLQDVVQLTGFRSDTADIVASLDILAMPSWAETFGRVLLEAMASQVAVIATNAGGVPDIIENEVDGLLVPPRDVSALATALRRLATDHVQRAALSQRGFQKAKRQYELTLVRAQLDRILTATREEA